MKDPFDQTRELLTADEVAKIQADFDARWDDLQTNGIYANGGDKKYGKLILDQFFAPWEVSHPLVAELMRRKSA